MAFLPLLMITLSNFCAARKPNILFMLADDIGWADISYYGKDIKTPHIDSLFKTGIELTNYYTHPTCSPTRSAILTGLYSFQNGLQWLDTIPPGSAEHIPFQIRGNKVSTMMELLRDEFNFANEMIGKWHLGYASWNDTPTGRGFDNHYGFFQDAQDYFNHTTLSPKPDITGHPQVEGYDFWDNKKDIHQAVQHDYSTGLFENRFTKVITNYANLPVQNRKPLFMYLPFQTVHTPSTEIGHNMDYGQCNQIKDIHRQRYCDKIVRLDLFIGTIIETYKNHSLWNDTLVVLTSDNGGMPHWSDNNTHLSQGVAVSRGCNMPYRAGKATLYEGGVKSFGVINGGDNIIPDNRRNHSFSGLMHSIDWLPTIYQGLLGGSSINTNNITRFGLDLWDQIINNKISNETSDRTLFLDIEANGSFAGVRQGDYKYFTGRLNDPKYDCLVYEDKTLGPCLLYHGYYPCNQSKPYDTNVTETHFLYNIRTDPFEQNNLARDPEFGDLVAHFNRTIQNFVKSEDYMQEQSSIFHVESIPDDNNNYTWAPWL